MKTHESRPCFLSTYCFVATTIPQIHATPIVIQKFGRRAKVHTNLLQMMPIIYNTYIPRIAATYHLQDQFALYNP
jgi:hypothetical protein